ncbi:MAG: Gfo/Idh/MocA family oxidoreductase [Oscillospiraceae bacterium]|nr:Gfo/Idh/MocA family oxidoreductase [Oscillospiraceae bacterium]
MFRFAIMGAGHIANKFCDAIRRIDGAEVAAVASQSGRAKDFALVNGIPAYFDSYSEMLEAAKPDCVYVAATSNAHYELSKLCIESGVPVLCEKAMFLNSKDAKEVFGLAESKGVFAMEAMWSRFLPAVVKAREWIHSGRIGEPIYATSAIGFKAEENPANRYYCKALGGGAAFDLTVYDYEILTFLIDRPAEVISAHAVKTHDGVDLTDHILLRFPKDGCRDCLAVCESTLLAKLDEKIVIYGSEGKLELPRPHFATDCYLYNANFELVDSFKDDVTENGFVYEAMEAINCIKSGKTESETVPHGLTIACAEMFDELLRE